MKKIAVFASGSGTNAQSIIEYFLDKYDKNIVDLVLSNKPEAYVLERAKNFDITTVLFTREQLNQTDDIAKLLIVRGIHLIVLAGFLWLVPQNILQAYPNRIINIHPALLPKYGGKGMYGMNVHKAVLENRETESGISIHYVNEEYDKGDIIFQAKCKVEPGDTPESLAQRIHALEYEHFPKVIEKLLFGQKIY